MEYSLLRKLDKDFKESMKSPMKKSKKSFLAWILMEAEKLTIQVLNLLLLQEFLAATMERSVYMKEEKLH